MGAAGRELLAGAAAEIFFQNLTVVCLFSSDYEPRACAGLKNQ
jgi:hypothetical protein